MLTALLLSVALTGQVPTPSPTNGFVPPPTKASPDPVAPVASTQAPYPVGQAPAPAGYYSQTTTTYSTGAPCGATYSAPVYAEPVYYNQAPVRGKFKQVLKFKGGRRAARSCGGCG